MTEEGHGRLEALGWARDRLPDLIIVATAKYLMDFFDLPKNRLHIVTMDADLRAGAQRIPELPYVYDPTDDADRARRVFR